jgi:prolyl oligopeptidase
MSHVTRACLRLGALALLAAPAVPPAARATLPPYPPTRVEIVRDTLHGVVLEDPYRWLEDQDAPETRAWIAAQNRYRESVMAEVPGLDRIRARLAQVMVVGSSGVPVERGGRYFFRRRAADQDLNVLVVRDGPRGRDRVLADPHPLSADHSTSLEYTDISPDGRLVAIGTRQGGADELSVGFRDVASGRDLPDRLGPMDFFGLVIAPDLRAVYYVKFTPEGPRVLRHAMGTDPAGDPVVFGPGYGPEHFVDLALSEEGRTLLATVSVGSGSGRTELWVKDLAADGPFTPVVRGLDAAFSGVVAGDQLYVQTNWRAPRGRILRVDLRDPAPGRWVEVVPEGRGVIERFALAGGRIVVTTLEDVVPRVRTYSADGRALGEISFPVPGEVGSLGGRWDSDEAFFSFESLVVPTTIYRWDVASGKRTIWWRSSAPVDGGRYETKQVWYPSRDGTRVPMFVVHRKGLALDGTHPLYLTGYGGFTVNMTPAFSALAALWVEAGGVFALPNLRGGAELGEEWHRAGMLERKQNTFDDFTAAAEWLTRNGYADPARIAIRGGSNGGLLVGAALTQHPGMFRAVLCKYPLLDMLRYHRFRVARLWVPEYGSAEDSAQFEVLRAYSPYHHVVKGTAYPAVLLATGDADTRVDPLHARKMTALLQAATGSDRPVLLNYSLKAGHSQGRSIRDNLEDAAVDLHFLFWQLGVEAPWKAGGKATRRP